MSGLVDDIIGVLVKRHAPSFKIIQLLIIESIKHSTQHSKILHDFLTTWWNPLLMLLTLAHFVVNCNAYEYWQISQKCYRCLNTVKLEEQDCMASNSTVTTTYPFLLGMFYEAFVQSCNELIKNSLIIIAPPLRHPSTENHPNPSFGHL